MRLRNITGSREFIAENEFVVHEPEQYKGKWHELFGNRNPIHIEIGMGKGQFITTLAQQNPDINYIGIEKYSSVLLRAVEKQKELELNNLFLIRFDAEYICTLFDTDEIARIYLNFSDPWPKDRHAKRRLPSKNFLDRYNTFLQKNGYVQFKTDNDDLFQFSLEQAELAGWQATEVHWDFHNSEYAQDNVMTEYEEKFSGMGNPIHRCVLRR